VKNGSTGKKAKSVPIDTGSPEGGGSHDSKKEGQDSSISKGAKMKRKRLRVGSIGCRREKIRKKGKVSFSTKKLLLWEGK